MSFFNAFKKTMKNEGWYVNDKHDAGKETYRGISRKYNPSWKGWIIVDNLRKEDSFPENLKKDSVLNNLVIDFYKEHYWDKFDGDTIDFINQEISERLFDMAVNLGVKRTISFLQKALNYLNRNDVLFLELVEDGLLGGKTIQAIKRIVQSNDTDVLLNLLKLVQGSHYLNYIDKNKSQKRFIRGWVNRLDMR